MIGNLAFYRFIFIILNCYLAYKVAKRVITYLEKEKTYINEEKLEYDWKDVNLKEPPRLQSAVAERLRLNELLAVKAYDCKQKIQLGDTYEKYVLCEEFGPFKSAASISGDKAATGDLERQISAQSWIIFTPEGSQVVEKLTGDVEINYFTELEEWDHWHTWDLEQVLKGRRLDVAKFELYSPYFQSHDQPDVLRKLVPVSQHVMIQMILMKARQLLLTIEPGLSEKTAWKWYTLLYWLFFEHHYAITGAIPNGVCGSNPRKCRYRVSLAKIEEREIKSGPVFGLGFPLEERRRLLKFISEMKAGCTLSTSSSIIPRFCSQKFQKEDQIILVKLNVSFKEFGNLEDYSTLLLISPDTPSQIEINDKIKHLPWVISSLKSSSSTEKWNLRTIDDLVASAGGRIELLLLDIEGAEWELLPQLIASSENISQISIRGRLFPEENENYRKFYWQLYCLTKLGFVTRFSVVNDPFYEIILLKKK